MMRDLRDLKEMLNVDLIVKPPEKLGRLPGDVVDSHLIDFLLNNPGIDLTKARLEAAEKISGTTIGEILEEFIQQDSLGFYSLDFPEKVKLFGQWFRRRYELAPTTAHSLANLFFELYCSECGIASKHSSQYYCGNLRKLSDKRVDSAMVFIIDFISKNCLGSYDITETSLKIDSVPEYQLLSKASNESVKLSFNKYSEFIEKYRWWIEIESAELFIRATGIEVFFKFVLNPDVILQPQFNHLSVLTGYWLNFIEGYFDYDFNFSKNYKKEINEYLKDTPLALVSFACWCAKGTYLRQKDDGVYDKKAKNTAKSTLKYKLAEFSTTAEQEVKAKKYTYHVEIEDSLIDYVDAINEDFDFEYLKTMSPRKLNEALTSLN
jgi:hypothetical protein